MNSKGIVVLKSISTITKNNVFFNNVDILLFVQKKKKEVML